MAAKDWSMTSNQQPATSNQQPATSNQQPALVFNLSALLSNPIPLSLAHAICIFFSCFQFLSIFACCSAFTFLLFQIFCCTDLLFLMNPF
ncbi:MAG: hypothetical protein NTZ86_04040 [Legionellales bacterium]|nr:hypothetical protein [Legionellales bacterium]